MLQLPLRIAILECDVPLDSTRAKYGGYGNVFKALLDAGADSLGNPNISSKRGLELTYWDVMQGKYPPLDSVDAILMTGSRYNSFDNQPWILKLVDFTKEVLAQDRVRIIGVCFGHQIVGRALGVEVGRSPAGWEVSVTTVELTKKGKEVFGRSKLDLHQMHRDAVFEYPHGVEQLAYTTGCSVQGMYIARRLITVQGHPEFTEKIVSEILEKRNELGIIDDTTFSDGISRVGREQDGVVVAQAFLRFLLE